MAVFEYRVYEVVPGRLPIVARVRNQFWRATEYSPLK
jgi:hypothetical protein